jgi:hypothetical protein
MESEPEEKSQNKRSGIGDELVSESIDFPHRRLTALKCCELGFRTASDRVIFHLLLFVWKCFERRQ